MGGLIFNNFTRLLDDVSQKDLDLVGGKSASLGELARAGFCVPNGFVITTSAFYKFAHARPSDDFKNNTLSVFDQLGLERVAVRSSAIAEDSAEASWAGQLDTYLNITRSGLLEAIEKCWQSINTEHAKAYAKDHFVSEQRRAVAVVVQAMVSSDISGVMFTANPVSGNTAECVVEAVYGLGEMLVQGAVTPENFILNKSTGGVLSHTLHHQTKMLAYVAGSNKEVNVPKSKLGMGILSKTQLEELLSTGINIEKHYGKPQDIEWAIAGYKLYIVQSRPITTL